MIALTWIAIPDQFDPVLVDDFVVMPDHVHGLISIDCDEVPSGSMSLSEVIGWFKGKTTHLYGKGVADRGWPRYRGHLWQPRFHDHIIRDERDYESRVKYIEGNPARWVESRSARSERE
jgi:REP element-mobilizing transposase RayT